MRNEAPAIELGIHSGSTAVRTAATGFFRTAWVGGRWWLISPAGDGVAPLGLSPADTTGRPDQVEVNGSAGRGRAERGPFVQAMRFAEIESWNEVPRFPDVFSREFREYCDQLARRSTRRGDEQLVGYSFVDLPAWTPHPSGRAFPGLDGLSAARYEWKLYDIARKYYDVTTQAIRRYDPDRLVLGDRYDGNRGIPTLVLEAARPHIDVLAVRYLSGRGDAARDRMRTDLAEWGELMGKPLLLANRPLGPHIRTVGRSATPAG